MDYIRVKGMRFFAHHGVHEEEILDGQPFEIDVELGCDLSRAGSSDDLSRTCDYAGIYQIVSEIIDSRRFNLIEALAEEISDRVLDWFPYCIVKVAVRKPKAPLPGDFDYAEVELHRGPRVIGLP